MTPASISHYTASLFTHTHTRRNKKLFPNLIFEFFPPGVLYIFFLPISISVLFICSFVHFSISSALKIRFPGYDKSPAMYSFWSWNKVYRVLPAHLLCQSKGQVENIFFFFFFLRLKVCAKSEERQGWNRLESERKKKKSHTQKVKVCISEGRRRRRRREGGGGWRHVQYATEKRESQ